MNIALFGYGKMGKMIEQLAMGRGHTITAKVDVDSPEIDFTKVDVAIDFSTPDAAFDNLKRCFENQTPVVCGTTGWLDQYDEAINLCNTNATGFIYASNFSLGVNLFFALNEKLAKMMQGVEGYEATMEEIHHTQKLDAPSGTAITLAEGIIANHSKYNQWDLYTKSASDAIPVTAKRIVRVPGTHTIDYSSQVDSIEIKHTAHNREGFALGAIMAAEWLKDKKGVYSMKDVLNLSE